MDSKDVDVRVENNVLTLRGERRIDKEVKRESYHRVERAYGSFSRSFTLPSMVDTTRRSRPTFTKDGVLSPRRSTQEGSRGQAAWSAKSASRGLVTAPPRGPARAQAIYREGIKSVTAGMNPMEIKHGIDRAVEIVVEEVKKLSKPVKGTMIAQVGTISANSDETIGKIIAEAMEKVGKDGVITVEESRSMETSLEVVEGMRFDRGYSSPYFVTDSERMEAVLDDAYILSFEKKISNMKDLPSVLEKGHEGKPP